MHRNWLRSTWTTYDLLKLFLPWTPAINKHDIHEQPLEAFHKGSFHKMPIMLGTVAEETLIFIYKAVQREVNDAEYSIVIFGIFWEDGIRVIDWYPPTPFVGDKRPALAYIGTDYVFTASTRFAAEGLFKHNGNEPVYLYQFNHSLSFDGWGPNYTYCEGHACHGVDLPYVFHSTGPYKFTPDEENLSGQMIDYWTNFARTGDPNKGRTVNVMWPKFDTSTWSNMEFQTPYNHVVQKLRKGFSDFWDELGYHWGW